MKKVAGLILATAVAATSASAVPAKPSDVIKTFAKSDALAELLDDHHGYTSVTIGVLSNVSDAVEALCNQHSRSRTIVAVTLAQGFNAREFYFQTPESPSKLTRCIPNSPSDL